MELSYADFKVDEDAEEDYIPGGESFVATISFRDDFLFGCVSSAADSTEIQPCGLLSLGEECILEAKFDCSAPYDSFIVIDPAPLKCAIEKKYPWAAMKMKTSLHMTVSYPGKRKVSGLSDAYDNVFAKASDFPMVNLYIREIYVSADKYFGSAVVAAVDSAIMFTFYNKGTPAHLTLWGNPPVYAGRMLIGQPITLRDPFIAVTDERVVASMAEKIKELAKLRSSLFSTERNLNSTERNLNSTMEKLHSTERNLGKLQSHCTILEGLLARRVALVQLYVRRWLLHLRMRRLSKLTPRQRAVLTAFLDKWKRIKEIEREIGETRYDIYSDLDYLTNFMGY